MDNSGMTRLLHLLVLCPLLAFAPSWPAHPITILMGFPAGSGADQDPHLLQEPIEESLHGKIATGDPTGAGANPAPEAGPGPNPGGAHPRCGAGGRRGRQPGP